jgi:hypothetical protein
MKNNQMFTDDGHKILLGDVLMSEDGYFVVVCQDDDGPFYGSLLCSINHSCRNVGYHLNNGKGHFYTKLNIMNFTP